ncbi:hypothetical protein [Burkholderia glumae]|uniref:hypothetical protein n=1 Tax=Burkholderia glumae TaxID=337 RepID=UPI0015935BF6|nr:hypothetical protein [Burkholderia glumae]NVE22311.1 hypothetical protein [Burkholderia glumae]
MKPVEVIFIGRFFFPIQRKSKKCASAIKHNRLRLIADAFGIANDSIGKVVSWRYLARDHRRLSRGCGSSKPGIAVRTARATHGPPGFRVNRPPCPCPP